MTNVGIANKALICLLSYKLTINNLMSIALFSFFVGGGGGVESHIN